MIVEEIQKATTEIENESFKMFTVETLEKMTTDIADIKDFLKKLVDEKTIKTDELESKQLVQSAVRSLNEALRGFKKR